MQIAAQRWIAELIEQRRITRAQKSLLEELAKHVDARRTTQKSIAFLAKRSGMSERTVQRHLRGLCPSKGKDPEGWANRIVTRRFIHAAPEPGKKADNVPSWFTLEIPEPFFTPKTPAPLRTVTPPRVASTLSPGGGQNVTQAVIMGSGSTEITETLHPCTNLAGASGGKAESKPPPPPPAKAAPPPLPPPAGGTDVLVVFCAKLFPSHAPIAHRSIARLQALGWTDDEIAAYLRKAAKEPGTGQARHPLSLVVWLAEKEFRDRPKIARAERTAEPPENPPASVDVDARARDASPIDPRLLSSIEGARAAQRSTPTAKRRLSASELQDGDRGGGEPSESKIDRARRALEQVEKRVGVRRRPASEPKEPEK